MKLEVFVKYTLELLVYTGWECISDEGSEEMWSCKLARNEVQERGTDSKKYKTIGRTSQD